jgi:hypothetical protein
MNAPEPAPPPPPFASAAEAGAVIGHLADVMDALLGIIENETELVRAGRLREASTLERDKAALAQQYIADVMRLRAGQDYLTATVPEALAALAQRHDTFRALLQVNLTVLATAHAVSEGILRGVSESLARKAAPQTYGASGRPTVPAASAQPLAVSRVL